MATSTAVQKKPLGPFKLVTVNTAPERAARLIGRLVEALQEDYTIQHVANVTAIEEVKPTVEKHQPDLLFCASMWTPEQSSEIQAIARSTVPGIKTHAIPQGLQVQKGPDAIVEYLLENVPPLLSSPNRFAESVDGFRQHLPDLNTPRFQIAKEQSPYEYSEAFQRDHAPPWLHNLTETWTELLREPFKGITVDGNVIPGLFQHEDQDVPIEAIVASTESFLGQLTPEQKIAVSFPVNAREWRAWSNPEMLLRPFGLRLEEQSEKVTGAILAILETTFSPEGYQKALAAMRVNHFLGEICQLPKIMNSLSYNFLLFGEPSTDKPWGWSLYGHHLCLSVLLLGGHIVISPTFTGAEPNVIDQGEWKGTQILNIEEELGWQLMSSLSEQNKEKAQIYKMMRDPGMLQTGDLKTDRWNRDDQRHLCGAFRDNRIVPYEGLRVSELDSQQQEIILSIAEQFTLYLPARSRRLRLEEIKAHFDTTFFSWIGSWGEFDPFYYRIQSPVVIMEFDHHSGVFLNNTEPARFHVHTILRTPNAGDYGYALRESECR